MLFARSRNRDILPNYCRASSGYLTQMEKHQDYYKILRVSENATFQEIKQAFRQLARDCHPDLNPNDANAAERFRLLREAYEVLSDHQKRQQYDRLRNPQPQGTQINNDPSPKNPQIHYVRGVDKIYSQDYWGAVIALSEAIRFHPYFIEAYLKRCEAYLQLGREVEILKDCQQILKIQPHNAIAYYFRGRARYRLGYIDSALRAYSKAIGFKPEFAPSYYYRGFTHYDLGYRAQAIADWQTYTQICRQQGDERGYRLGLNTLSQYSWLHYQVTLGALKGSRYGQGVFHAYLSLVALLRNSLGQIPLIVQAGITVFLQLLSDPVRGILTTYSQFNKQMTILVSVVLLAFGDWAMVMGVLSYREIAAESILPLIIVGLMPTLAIALVSLLIRYLLAYDRDWSIDLFLGSSAILPLAILILFSNLLPDVLLVIFAIFSISHTILLLYGGCSQLLNVSESLAAIIIPLMILSSTLLTTLGVALLF